MNKFTQTGILGKTGFGKTFLTLSLMRGNRRKIIFDPHAQFEKNGFFNSYSLNDTIMKLTDNEGVLKRYFSINCIYENLDDYTKLLKICWGIENYLLVIDEITLFAETHRLNSDLKKILTRGRLKNIALLWNTQRPAMIDRTLTSQCYNVISFCLNDIADLKYFSLERVKKQQVISLKKREWVVIYGSLDELENYFGDLNDNVKKYLKN